MQYSGQHQGRGSSLSLFKRAWRDRGARVVAPRTSTRPRLSTLPGGAAGLAALDGAGTGARGCQDPIPIVHPHLFVGSMFASPLARLARVRAVVETFHLPEVWRTGKRLKRSFWLDRQVARCVDRYVAVSAAAAGHLTDRKRIPKRKVRTIYNGRDLSRFHPPSVAEHRAARVAFGLVGEPAVGVIGRLEPQKGHALMLEAAAILTPPRSAPKVLF